MRSGRSLGRYKGIDFFRQRVILEKEGTGVSAPSSSPALHYQALARQGCLVDSFFSCSPYF